MKQPLPTQLPPLKARQVALHVGLFLATFGSMTATWYFARPARDQAAFIEAVLFAGSALAILLAHELGHWLMARQHGVDSSLPWFIPVPFGFGTMGAVIQLKGKIPSRNALFDVGAAGPLCGLLVALPLLVVGVKLSSLAPSPSPPFPPSSSLLSLAADAGTAIRAWLHGESLPDAPAGVQEYQVFGDNLLTWGLTRLTWGKLEKGVDLDAHPVFIAAWFGLLVTMFNLLPSGQLDGGHVMRAVLGPERAELVGPQVASLTLILALLCSATWLVWFFMLVRFIGFGHPPPEDDQTPLSRGRLVGAVAVWVLTVLCFIPVPLDVVTM